MSTPYQPPRPGEIPAPVPQEALQHVPSEAQPAPVVAPVEQPPAPAAPVTPEAEGHLPADSYKLDELKDRLETPVVAESELVEEPTDERAKSLAVVV